MFFHLYFKDKYLYTNYIEKYTIYRTGSLGDTIVSLASIQLIKNLNPDNKIFFFSIKNEDPNSVSPIEIIKDLNIINEFIELNNITSLKSF